MEKMDSISQTPPTEVVKVKKPRAKKPDKSVEIVNHTETQPTVNHAEVVKVKKPRAKKTDKSVEIVNHTEAQPIVKKTRAKKTDKVEVDVVVSPKVSKRPAKGSQEAKDIMAKVRALRKPKPKPEPVS